MTPSPNRGSWRDALSLGRALGQYAAGEISKEEAERRIDEVQQGTPIRPQAPQGVRQPSSRSRRHRRPRCGRRQNPDARPPRALAARSVPDSREEPVMTLLLPDRELRDFPAADQAIRAGQDLSGGRS